MPDRAVVNPTCPKCDCLVIEKGRDWYCQGCDLLWYPREVVMPQPRALCAISEDRQWLVVLGKGGSFYVLEKDGMHYFSEGEFFEDTGQSAEDVLREWMEGREGHA